MRHHEISLGLRILTKHTMASQSPETTSLCEADKAITRGTGNVFIDLGYADAEERQTKLRLAHAINGVIARRRLTQAVTAEKLGINQPKVLALANYKLNGFSVERLMIFLAALGQDVEIVIRNKPRWRPAGRISVVAA
jgi:predicted XRE-type DNA-binding protein